MKEIVFNPIPHDEQIIVRMNGEYLGKLIRTGGAGPIWANEDLRYALGTPFTFDGHTNAACAEVERILQERART